MICVMCGESEETTSHLFFGCRIVTKVMCDFWIRVSNVYHNQVRINFNHFCLMELNKNENNIWKGI